MLSSYCLSSERLSPMSVTFSHNNPQGMTNSVPEITEVRTQLQEWWVMLHLHV